MKLFYSPNSPSVRKVLVTAWERNVYDKIELLPQSTHTFHPDPELVAVNPTGQLPCALTPSGAMLFDSRVIGQYVDQLSLHGDSLYEGTDRFAILTLEALGDALLDACIQCYAESDWRPKDLYWNDWHHHHMQKINGGLYDLEHKWRHHLDTPHFHAGAITIACFLSYLDFRFIHKDWRTHHPKLADWFRVISKRPSMQRTLLHD